MSLSRGRGLVVSVDCELYFVVSRVIRRINRIFVRDSDHHNSEFKSRDFSTHVIQSLVRLSNSPGPFTFPCIAAQRSSVHPPKDVPQISTSHTTFLKKGLLPLLKAPWWSLLQLVQTTQSRPSRQRKVPHSR